MVTLYKIGYIVLSYLLGSILFAEISVRLIKKQSLFEISENHNPGVSNAFKDAGILCGSIAVIGDLAKGIIPVYFYSRIFGGNDLGITFVMAAVSLGHAFPIFFRFRGGMCIAVTFGALLGLWPNYYSAVILAVLYVLGLIIKICGNSLLTIIVFGIYSIVSLFMFYFDFIEIGVLLGILILSAMVCIRIWPDVAPEDREKLDAIAVKIRSRNSHE